MHEYEIITTVIHHGSQIMQKDLITSY